MWRSVPTEVLSSDRDLLLSLGKMEFPLHTSAVRAALWPGSSTQSLCFGFTSAQHLGLRV